LRDSHAGDLEYDSAIKEFGEGHERPEAERRAYEDYRKKVHSEAAAHHLRGMRAAQASFDMPEAERHGMAYAAHLRALGHEPIDKVPPEVEAYLQQEEVKPQYKFKAHPADSLLEVDESRHNSPTEPKDGSGDKTSPKN
jgi:hypothetical protein